MHRNTLSIYKTPCVPVGARTRLKANLSSTLFRYVPAVLAFLILSSGASARSILLEPIGARPDTFVSRMQWDKRLQPRVGFRLYIDFGTGTSLRTFREPGNYELRPVSARHHADPGIRAEIEIRSRSDWLTCLPPQKAYRRVSPADITSESFETGTKIAFEATLSAVRRSNRQGLFLETEEGVPCLVKDGNGYSAHLIRAAVPGQKLQFTGTVQAGKQVMIEDAQFLAENNTYPLRHRVWEVKLSHPQTKTKSFYRPGLYRFKLSCGGGTVECRAHLQEVKLAPITIGGHKLTAEVADTAPTRYYGLQGRNSLPPGKAMLFIFERPLIPEFVMKTVSFPISTAFFTDTGRLASLHQMDPGDQKPAKPLVPIRYVVETRQGWFSKHDLGRGALLQFKGSTP